MADIIQTSQVLPAQGFAGAIPKQRCWRGHLQASEYAWGLAFIIPYAIVFLAFVVYPIAFGIWMGSDIKLYRELLDDPVYWMTVVNTALYLGVAINLKLFLALMLSGFFMRKGWWNKALLVIFILPWAAPAIPGYISIHWMLNGQWGLINNIIWSLFQVDGPPWLDSSWYALGSVIYAHIWKWLPFWTIIFLAGRMAIPRELYEAAAVDGASRFHQFRHITIPLIAGLYLVCTLLSAIWALGDFNAVRFISGGGPALSTHVLATLGIRNAFELGNPALGMATVLSALPILIPLVALLIRQLKKGQVEL